jgi:hypothetical protein
MRKRPPVGSGQAANISGVLHRSRRANKSNVIALVKAQRLNKIRFHRIIVILQVFKRWVAAEVGTDDRAPLRGVDAINLACSGVKEFHRIQ